MSYDRQRRLGQGFFGSVWLEFDNILERHVAAKYPDMSKLARPEDAFNEARSMVAVDHENLVQVISAEESPIPVIRMTYLPEGSIADNYGGRPLPTLQACKWIEDACRGVEHLHLMGILHRDIKPANLLIDGEAVRVSDFGLACRLDALAEASPIGYTTHVPPESIFQGFIDDTLGDVYALGVTLYRLLNGDEIFNSGRANADFRLAIRTGQYPDRSKWQPHLHTKLVKVAQKAMSLEPSKRYQSATEFRHGLEKARPVVSWSNNSLMADTTEWSGKNALTGDEWMATLNVSMGKSRFEIRRQLQGKAWRTLRKEGFASLSAAAAKEYAAKVLQRVAVQGV